MYHNLEIALFLKIVERAFNMNRILGLEYFKLDRRL